MPQLQCPVLVPVKTVWPYHIENKPPKETLVTATMYFSRQPGREHTTYIVIVQSVILLRQNIKALASKVKWFPYNRTWRWSDISWCEMKKCWQNVVGNNPLRICSRPT